MNQTPPLDQPASQVATDGRLSLLEVLTALGEEKRVFLGVWGLGTALALGIVLSLPRYYSATTVILPPQQQQSAAAGALAQLGALAGVAGASVGMKTPDDMYVAFLRTQRIDDALVKRFKLQSRYEFPSMEDARARLSALVQVSSDKKTGLISVTADDRDPAFAAELANAHVDELRQLMSQLAVTEAQQRRVFFEQQVNKTKEALHLAETSFRKEQAQSGFVVAQAMAESSVRSLVELQNKIASLEVQLRALGQFSTPQNPDYQRGAAELAALKQQLLQLESGSGSPSSDKVSGSAAVKAYREMRVQEAALEALIRQFEVAKLDESREGPLIQQVDVAMPPEYPSKPKRMFLVLAPSMLAMLLGAVIAYFRAHKKRPSRESAERWSKLKSAWL